MPPPLPTLAQSLPTWLAVAAQSFGGPAGQIAVMHRILVVERRWLSEERFLHALHYCMLLPGPEAQQLATCVGWQLHGWRGGLLAGLLFILPGFLSILALSLLYTHAAQLPAVAAALFGVKAAVVALVLEALLRISRRVLRGPAMMAMSAMALVAIGLFDLPFPAIVLAAALLGLLLQRLAPQLLRPLAAPAAPAATGLALEPPLLDAWLEQSPPPPPRLSQTLATAALWLAIWLLPLVGLRLGLGPDHIQTQLYAFFAEAAVVTFGGAYALLGHVAKEAVEGRSWLTAAEMLDGLGMAETTPGPLIQVVQFVGYLAAHRQPGASSPAMAGLCASLLTTWATFAPSFLWIFTGAPYLERLRRDPRLQAALSAISAAIVGVIAHLALWFALHLWFRLHTPLQLGPLGLSLPQLESADLAAILTSVAAAVALLRYHVSMPLTLGLSALAGLALHLWPR